MDHWGRGIFEEITEVSARLALVPGDSWCLMRKARLWLRLGEAEQAIGDFSLALTSAPKPPFPRFRPFIERGLTYFGEGMYCKALADFNEAIFIVPVFPNVFCYRAETHRALEEHASEIIDYSSALALSPGDTNILFWRAEAYAEIAQYEEAIQDFTQVIIESDRAENSSAEAYYGRGLAFYALGDDFRAVADYTEAIRLRPRMGTYLIARSLAFLQLGDYRQCRLSAIMGHNWR